MKPLLAVGWTALVLSAAPMLARASTADDMWALLDAGKNNEAYQLGSAHPEEFGTPAFDFQFGVAAIDSGHAGEGVLALERFVLQFPDNIAARAQLARGYFVLGDDVRAKQELDGLLALNPPPDVRTSIDRYLTAIHDREGAYKTTSSIFVEVGTGFDSNANSGAPSADLNLPLNGVLSPVTLLPDQVHIASAFQTLAVGGQISTPIQPGLAAIAGAYLDEHYNDAHDAHAYNVFTYGINGGVSWVHDSDIVRGTLNVDELDLDNVRYYQDAGVTLDWNHSLSPLDSIVPSVQYLALNYPSQSIRDSSLATIGLTYRRAFEITWQPVASVTAGYGEEHNSGGADNLSRNIYSVRLAVGISPQPAWNFSSGISYQESDYRAPEPLILITRTDDYAAFDAVAVYQWSRALSLRSDLLIASNHSNLGIFTYHRNVIDFKMRYVFE